MTGRAPLDQGDSLRSTRRRIACWVASLSLTCAIICACSSGPARGGPLEIGGAQAIQCVPSDNGQEVTIGVGVIRNDSDRPWSLGSVRLIEPSNLELRHVHFVPIKDRTLIGVALSWPPPSVLEDDSTWSERRIPEQAEIAPGEELNLVVGVTPTRNVDASAEGLRVAYSNGHDEYVDSTTTAIRVPAEGPCT